MITVKGRELIIPKSEQQIGTSYDNNAEVRHICIDRVTSRGIDIANLNYRLDLEYANKVLDTSLLDVEVQDDYILLTWTIPASCVAVKGTVWIAIRAYDESGTIKWASNKGAVYVGHTIFDGEGHTANLTELEQLEERIRQRSETLDASEEVRQNNEQIRQENERQRINNETEWQRQAETAINTANETLRESKEQAGIATRKATESTQKAKEASDSATAAAGSAAVASEKEASATQKAKESSDSATAAAGSAATASEKEASATQKAKEALDSAVAAAGSAAIAGEKEAVATQKAKESSDSATAASGSAAIACEKEAAATRKAAEAKNSADDAKRYAEQCAGVAEFDGTASTVSAIDTQGIAVKKASGTGHVTITDAAEHPLLNLNLAGKSEQAVTTGTQLFDAGNLINTNTETSIADDGKTITVSGSKAYSRASVNIAIDLVAGKQITLSGNISVVSTGVERCAEEAQVTVTLADGTKQYYSIKSTSSQITFDVPIDTQNVMLGLYPNNSANVLDTPNVIKFTNIMLNAGDTSKPWEPYTGGKPSPSPEYPQEIVGPDITEVMVTGTDQSKTATITLTEPLHGIGDVRDRIMCRDGVWGVERYLIEITFDGSEDEQWDIVSTNTNEKKRLRPKSILDFKPVKTNSIVSPGLSNLFGFVTGGGTGTYGANNGISIDDAGNLMVYYEKYNTVNALSAWKEFLQSNNLIVVAPLAIPTWEPFPSDTQFALNALTTYTGTTHVTITAGGPEPDVGLEYFGQPGDKVTVQDMCDSFAAPGFDDSGEVQGISGFSDFLNRMTSGMRLPSFFRNLKAGLKFVLHTGQLVNNGLCNEPGKYPLDAAYGRTLLNMIGNTADLPGGAVDIVSAIVTQNSNLDALDSDLALKADANDMEGKLNNQSPNILMSVSMGSYGNQGTPTFKINDVDYIVPISLYAAGSYSPVRLNIVTNPTTNKRSLKILWYADGMIHENYFDATQ